MKHTPRLTEEDIKACLAYAEAVIEGEDIYPFEEDEKEENQLSSNA